MKIQITYTETQITTYTKEVEVTKKQLKELQKRGAFYDTLTEELEQGGRRPRRSIGRLKAITN